VNDPDLDAEFARIIAGWDSEAPDPSPASASEPASVADPADDTLTGTAADASPADGAEPTVDPVTAAPSEPRDPQPEHPELDEQGLEHPGTSPAERTDGTGPATLDRGLLGLPIAPTTAHVWRGAEPPREDVDDLLDSVDSTEDHFVPPTHPDLPTAEDDPMFWAIVVGLAGGPLLLLYVLLFDREGSGWWVVTAITMIVVGFVLLVLRGGTERDPTDDGTRV
jgi:hypothetical protein